MAKKGRIEREHKRLRLVQKFLTKRKELKAALLASNSLEERLEIQRELQKLPRNSAPVRLRNRCRISGRSRGYSRDFGLSRHFLRELANQGVLPGVIKSSW
jgi:small subunit ribosomal protein S14